MSLLPNPLLNPYTKGCLYGPKDPQALWQKSAEYRHLCDVLEEKELNLTFTQEMIGLALVSETAFGGAGLGALIKAQQDVYNSTLIQQALERQAHMRLEVVLKDPSHPLFLTHVAQILPFLTLSDLKTLKTLCRVTPNIGCQDQLNMFSSAVKESLHEFLSHKDTEKIDEAVALAKNYLPSHLYEEVNFLAVLGDNNHFMEALDCSLTSEQIKNNLEHVYRVLHRKEPFVFGAGQTWSRTDGLPFLRKAVKKWGEEILAPIRKWFQIDYNESFQSNIDYYRQVCHIVGKDASKDTESLSEIFQIDFTSLVDADEYLENLKIFSPPKNLPLTLETGVWSKEFLPQLDYQSENIKKNYLEAKKNPLTPNGFLTASYCLTLACGHTVDPPSVLDFFHFPNDEQWNGLIQEHLTDPDVGNILQAFKNNYDNLKMKHVLEEELEVNHKNPSSVKKTHRKKM